MSSSDHITFDRHGRRLERMSLAKKAELRRSYMANIPGWRQPIIGYLASIPIVALGVITTFGLHYFLHLLNFTTSILMVGLLLVSLFWGVGPALLALAASTLAIDYYFSDPYNQFKLSSWHSIAQVLPFLVAGLTIALITGQRERARLRALATEQELQDYARELEEANQRLEDANQIKDHFMSVASHELKTPITTIRGQSQLVLRRLAKKDTSDIDGMRNSLEKINEQSGRLTNLIDELLDVSSIRAGKVALHKRKIDLNELCSEVVEDQRMLTGRTIQLQMPSTSIKITVDRDRISQVLINLVNNALKYSPEEKPVEVSLEQTANEKVLIQVCDHGVGIPKDQQQRIFETFYRTPDAQASSKRGLGLGLAIASDIVERHQGRIWCESEPGQGSIFSVELPAH